MKLKINILPSLVLVIVFLSASSLELKAETYIDSQRVQSKQAQKVKKSGAQYIDSTLVKPCAFKGTITDKEAKGLQFMYEEEKMARDVYAYLYEKYEMRVFGNITKSEQMHMSAIAGLLDGASITYKSNGKVGEFSIKQIQDLYDRLISKGDLSRKDALEVGVLIEEMDIKDLEKEIENAKNESIKQVYRNLLAASNRHLQAFNRNLGK